MPPSLLKTPLGLARGLCASLSLTAGAVSIHSVQLAALPLALVHKPSFRALIDHSQAAFAELLFIIHCTFGPQTTLVVSADHGALSSLEWDRLVTRGSVTDRSDGDDDDSINIAEQGQDDRTVLVSNHQTLLDWTFLWFLTLPLRRAAALKIILKQTPKYVPVFGPGMLFFQFIFLSRNRTRDIPQLHRAMDRLLSSKGHKWLLLFPEGTILTANTSRITTDYAHKSGIPAHQIPSATLLPRSTGLAVILSRLFPSQQPATSATSDRTPKPASHAPFTRLLDVTLSFAYADPQTNRAAWACGQFPGNIFTPRSMYASYAPHPLRIACHVARRAPPATVDEVPAWTAGVWRDKEQKVLAMREGNVSSQAAQRVVEAQLTLSGFWPRHLVPYIVGVPAVGVAVVWCVGRVYWS